MEKSVIVAGDSNTVSASYVEAPPAADSVDIRAELAALRAAIEALAAPDARKIANAFDDAEAELDKPSPDREEIGGALERAVRYAKGANSFAEQAEKLMPHIRNAAAWLGTAGAGLLAVLGV